jgi:hypothetical protein
MPKVTKHKARQNIYQNGYRTENAKTKSGYSVDRSKPRDADDKLLVEKGQEYYTWQKFRSPRQYSLTYPDRRLLTSSDYLITLYDIEDEINAIEASSVEDLESALDSIKEQIESLRDEQQEKLDNMPEQLQENSDAGMMLQERYDALDTACDSLGGIDLSYDEPDDDELRDEFDEDAEVTDEMLEEKREEKLQEWIQEKIGEVQEVSLDG